MPVLAVPAHAKVNLALEVTGRRPDGYHDLATVFLAIDWHDLVCVATGPPDTADTVTVEGPAASPEMAMPDALVGRALGAARRLADARDRPRSATSLHAQVVKRIPAGAGLGGGSADAAASLRAGTRVLVGTDLDTAGPALLDAAAGLGADVPATLLGGVHLAAGRGDLLEPLPRPVLDLVVAVAGASSTAATYAALTDAERRRDGRAGRVAEALRCGLWPDPRDLGSALEAPARRANPGLGSELDRLREVFHEVAWHVTGSGGAAFALVEDRTAALRLAARVASLGIPARACRPVGRTVPAPAYNRGP